MVVPSKGAWSSPVVLVQKKDGAWRFCIDYIRLTEVMEADAYQLTRFNQIFDALSGNNYFNTLDLASEYW